PIADAGSVFAVQLRQRLGGKYLQLPGEWPWRLHKLDHRHHDNLFPRIYPEGRSRGTTPAVLSYRAYDSPTEPTTLVFGTSVMTPNPSPNPLPLDTSLLVPGLRAAGRWSIVMSCMVLGDRMRTPSNPPPLRSISAKRM